MKFLLSCIVLVVLSLNAFGQDCGRQNSVLVFANGMFNDRIGASESLYHLWSRTNRHQKSFQVFALAFNTNESVLLQLYQVYRHKTVDLNVVFWSGIASLFESFSQDEVRKFVSDVLSEEKARDKDLRIQIAQYKTYLKRDWNIVTVAHSQGNFYTLFAFQDLNSSLLKMISVATPAHKVFSDGPYFTFKSDGVIKYIPKALPPNYEKVLPGIFDHEFLLDYMSEKGAEIVEEVIRTHSLHPRNKYFNSDLNSMLDWALGKINQTETLTPGECLAIHSLFINYTLKNRSCDERDFKSVAEIIEDCKNPSQPGKAYLCPRWKGSDHELFLVGPSYPNEAGSFYKKHKECDYSSSEFKKIERVAYLEGMEILNKVRPKK